MLKFNGDSITFSDNSTLASASGIGGGGNPFDQNLNTTDSPTFNEVTVSGIVFSDATTQNTAIGGRVAVQTADMVWDYEGNLTSGTLDLTQGNLGTVAGVYEGTLVLHGSSIGNHGLIHTLNGCEIIYDDAIDGLHLGDSPGWQPNLGTIKYQFIIKINNPSNFGLSLTPDITPGADPSDTITFKTGSFIILRPVLSSNIV